MPEKQWDAAQMNQWLINILIIGAWLTIVPLLKMSNTISVGYTDTLWHSDEKLVKVPKNRRMRAGKWFFSFLSPSLWLLTGRLCSTNLKTSSYYQIIPVCVCACILPNLPVHCCCCYSYDLLNSLSTSSTSVMCTDCCAGLRGEAQQAECEYTETEEANNTTSFFFSPPSPRHV